MKRLVVTGLAAFAVGAAPASAAPTELTGTMAVTTSTAASALVHIANTTRTFPDENGKGAIDFRFSGNSLLRGLILAAETVGPDGKRYIGFVDGAVGEAGEGDWSKGDIPAGDYRLYAFSDGRPTTVTIFMPSGSGASTLDLLDPVAADIHKMAPGGSGGVFRASGVTTGPGAIFMAAEATFGSGQAGTVEFCDAAGDSAETDAPYTLGCSEGDVSPAFGGSDFSSISESTRVDTPARARYGFGGNAQALTPPTFDGGVAAVTFTPSGAPGQSGAPVSPVGAVAARVVGNTVRVTKTGRAPVAVRCAGPVSCRVRLSLAGSSSKGKATIRVGATKKVNVRLSSSLRKRLKRKRSVKATLVLQVSSESGTGTTVTRRRITLKAPKR
jgi:hypothetical protein